MYRFVLAFFVVFLSYGDSILALTYISSVLYSQSSSVLYAQVFQWLAEDLI